MASTVTTKAARTPGGSDAREDNIRADEGQENYIRMGDGGRRGGDEGDESAKGVDPISLLGEAAESATAGRDLSAAKAAKSPAADWGAFAAAELKGRAAPQDVEPPGTKRAMPDAKEAYAALIALKEHIEALELADEDDDGPASSGDYPAYVVTRNIWRGFLFYRGLTPVAREVRIGAVDEAREAAPSEPTRDTVVAEMEHFGYVRIDADRKVARGKRDHVVILVLSTAGKYAHYSPDLRTLLGGVDSERATKDGRLDEVIIVAEDEFFRKKNLIEVLRTFKEKEAGGADLEGIGPIYSAVPYHTFSNIVPLHKSTQFHRVMNEEEVSAFLARERLGIRDLNTTYMDDPPMVWIGGRQGQCAQVMRDSETAAKAVAVRFINRAALM